MKTFIAALLLVATPTIAAEPTGYWLGILDAGAVKLRVGFHVEKNPEGSYTSTLASLDQGVRDAATDSTTFTNETLTIEMKKLGVRYTGTLANDAIAGTFSQSGHDLPLVLKRVAAFEEQKRPQEPKPPFAYRTEEISLRVKDGTTLAGTLTLPPGKGPFPAVLFVTGSGPQDRDEMILGHRPFLVIADALTKAGIATLRFDDRGMGKSGGSITNLTTTDFAGDALAEITYLAKRPEIDPRRVGIIGHSEGGLIAPMVAAQSDVPHFLVLLAGPGVPGREVIRTQTRAIMKAEGANDAEIEHALAMSGDTSPWMKQFLVLDPQTFLPRVKVPVLAMNGEKDLQVDPSNLDAIRRGLGKNPHVEIVRLPSLNHLFQHCTTGAAREYATIEETFAPDAIEKIRAFVLAR